ncbi:MAG: hypothetical protein IKC08_01170 [Lentisphaeria bacterium]|nr:hypothetical protein [Lentisphaeria bacterium]
MDKRNEDQAKYYLIILSIPYGFHNIVPNLHQNPAIHLKYIQSQEFSILAGNIFQFLF